jgi:hypothetical protein
MSHTLPLYIKQRHTSQIQPCHKGKACCRQATCMTIMLSGQLGSAGFALFNGRHSLEHQQ